VGCVATDGNGCPGRRSSKDVRMAVSSSDVKSHRGPEGSTRPARRSVTILCVIAFVAIVLVSCLRVSHHLNVPGVVSNEQWALIDFRDAVYYPTVSFLSGENPYDRAAFVEDFPVRVGFPPYTPLFLLVHVPFGVLPHTVSHLAYFGLTIGLTLVLAWLSLWMCGLSPNLASVTGVGTLILASRPGHWNLMLGQTALGFVLLVYIAMFTGWRSHWFSRFAFVGSTMKATFCLPLAILMVAQKQYKAVFIGACIATLLTLIPTIVLVNSAGGFTALSSSYLDSILSFENDPSANAVLSPSRIDAVALIARLSGQSPGPVARAALFVMTLGFAGMAIRWVRAHTQGRETDLFCISVASVTILVSTYQLTYAALLLVLPLIALILNRWAPVELAPGSTVRLALIVLLSIPFANHLVAPRFLYRLPDGSWGWRLLASVNGIVVLLALAVYVWVAIRRQPELPSAAD
jgi:hypothetical protein